MSNKPHQLKIFIALDDPYSYLLLQELPDFLQRFKVIPQLYLVNDKQTTMFPDMEKWQAHSIKDAAELAKLYKINVPMQVTFNNKQKESYLSALLKATANNQLTVVLNLLEQYWSGQPLNDVALLTEHEQAQLTTNFNHLKQHNHYLTGTIFYGGEWYWGLDRLDHLEDRLNQLKLNNRPVEIRYNKTWIASTSQKKSTVNANNKTAAFEIFYSARSPYSYLGLEKAAQLAKKLKVKLIIKPVMPMMMRGLNVPNIKKMYIFHDTKREATKLGIPYGFVADPLGQAVINCYAIYPYALSQGKELDYLLSFGRAVNSLGIRADTEKGLKTITENANLDWAQAKKYIHNQDYKNFTKTNINELSQLGLWGVPCFRYKNTVTWGQDRLWLIEHAISKGLQ